MGANDNDYPMANTHIKTHINYLQILLKILIQEYKAMVPGEANCRQVVFNLQRKLSLETLCLFETFA